MLGFVNAVDVWMGLSGEWTFARMPEAITQIRRGIALDPSSSQAYQALSVALGGPSTRDQALAAAQRSVELAPGEAEAWLMQPLLLLSFRPPAEALASAERAMQMYPIPPAYFHGSYSRVLLDQRPPRRRAARGPNLHPHSAAARRLPVRAVDGADPKRRA